MDYKKILVLCDQKKISPNDLAEKIGITRQGLLKAIKKQSMNINTVEFIAKTLEVSILEFIDDKYLLKIESENLQLKSRVSILNDQYGGEQLKSEMFEKEVIRLKEILEEKENLLLHYRINLMQYQKKFFPESEPPKE